MVILKCALDEPLFSKREGKVKKVKIPGYMKLKKFKSIISRPPSNRTNLDGRILLIRQAPMIQKS